MKDRRFKIGYVSMHIVASWGKDLGKQIQESIPEDAIILKQQECFERASIAIIIYHHSFDIIADGEKLPKLILDIPLNEEPPTNVIQYPH
jgi:hypothetical protein